MRIPWPAFVAGVVVAVVGVGGLVRGAVPQAAPASSAPSGDPIVVSGAFVHPPLPPNDTAAAYLTIDNTTSQPDTLVSVETGAGAGTVLHTTGADGAMHMAMGGVTVPAHGSLKFSVGKNHIMIERVYGELKAGQTVNLELDFAKAGSIDVTAPVMAYGTTAPPATTHGGHS